MILAECSEIVLLLGGILASDPQTSCSHRGDGWLVKWRQLANNQTSLLLRPIILLDVLHRICKHSRLNSLLSHHLVLVFILLIFVVLEELQEVSLLCLPDLHAPIELLHDLLEGHGGSAVTTISILRIRFKHVD